MDKAEVYRTLETFSPNQSLIEVRALHNTKKNEVWSGYFKDYDLLWESIQRFDSDYNIYFIFNVIDDSCYSMAQKDRMLYGAENTKDSDVIARSWVLIDLDANRNHKKISSTDEEWQDARHKAHAIRNYLRDMGFSYPIVCTSGNGIHLMYKIDEWAITSENDKLVSDFLNALALLFSDEKVDVDVKVGNAARITKLYGTVARKGANDSKRPHRLSKMLVIPDDIKCTDKDYFRKVTSILPIEEKVNYSSIKSGEGFNIDSFISEYGIAVQKESVVNGTRRIVLQECPFDSSHKAPDSAIFILPSGGMSFTCFHSSCSHYTFKDFRLHYDPNAYDKKDYQDFQHKQKYYGTSAPKIFERQKETNEKGKKWLSLKDVKNVSVSDLEYIPTGFFALDRAMKGLILGEVTLLSGLNGSGKSSWLNIIMLNAIQRGFKVACWSGELTAPRLKDWLYQSAAGKNYTTKESSTSNLYETDKKVIPKIDNWIDGKFFLFNNNYGCNWEQILLDVKDIIKTDSVKLIVIDNLMALSIDSKEGSSLEKQKCFIIDVCNIAKDNNVHVVLVAHPRKENSLLRKESISGTADLTNAVNNCILIHRIGEDFSKRAGEFFGKAKAEQYMEYSNVIELCKNRSFGIVDYLVGMYYECESKRFKNSQSEHICYGWEDPPKPQSISFPEPSVHWQDKESKDLSEVQAIYDKADSSLPFGESKDDCPF